jgi:CHAT domain-containing protein
MRALATALCLLALCFIAACVGAGAHKETIPAVASVTGSGIAAADAQIKAGLAKDGGDTIVATLPNRPSRRDRARWARGMQAAFDAYDDAEEFALARDTAARAAQGLAAIGAERDSLVFIERLAHAQIMLDDTASAERTIDAGLVRARAMALRDHTLETKFLVQKANAAHWAGDFNEAWMRIEPVLPALSALPPDEAIIRYRGFIMAGRAANRIGRRADAERWLKAAVAEAERAPHLLAKNALPVALEALSRLYDNETQNPTRVALLERAVQLYAQLPFAGDRSHAIMTSSLAFNLRPLRRFADAQTYAVRAADMNLALIQAKRLRPSGLTINDTAPALHAFDAVLATSLGQWPTGKDALRRDTLDVIVQTVQRAGAMVTVQDSNATAIAYAAVDPGARYALSATREAQARYDAIDARIGLIPARGGDVEALAALLSQRAAAAEDIIAKRNDLERRYPVYANLLDGQTETIAAIQASLRPREAVILLHAIQEHTILAIAVTRDDAVWGFDTFEYEEICRLTRAVRARFDPEGKISCRFPPRDLYSKPVAAEEEASAARALYQRLFAPLLPIIDGRSEWLIAPSGVLMDVPFALLRTADTGAPGKTPYLLRERALTILPSVSALVAARAGAEARATDKGGVRLVAAGAPCIGQRAGAACNAPEKAPDAANAPMPTTADIGVTRDATLIGNPGGIRLLPALPFAEAELRAAAALGGDASDLLLGPDATEAKVRARLTRPADLVVFATHGLTAGMFGMREPALVFTPPESVADATDDGLLSASEIARLDLSAEWIILSACRTAAADGTARGRTLSGLARAFFMAGAPALLASHWQVFDHAQSKIVTAAIAARLRDPTNSHAAALREAILEYLDDDASGRRDADPRAWGGLFVVGLSR